MDKVPRCHLLTPFQEGIHHYILSPRKNLNFASNVANWIIVDILNIFINLMQFQFDSSLSFKLNVLTT